MKCIRVGELELLHEKIEWKKKTHKKNWKKGKKRVTCMNDGLYLNIFFYFIYMSNKIMHIFPSVDDFSPVLSFGIWYRRSKWFLWFQILWWEFSFPLNIHHFHSPLVDINGWYKSYRFNSHSLEQFQDWHYLFLLIWTD